MSTNHTPNYNLCQWEAGDKVIRTDFNEDNAKIDAAIKAVDSRVDGKADIPALEGLAQTVASLSGTVSGHTAALSQKGNCQLYTTTYTGSGKYGSQTPTSLTFPKKPLVVFIAWSDYRMILFYGIGSATSERQGTGTGLSVIWNGNTVSWYSTTAEAQMNAGHTYQVYALLEL